MPFELVVRGTGYFGGPAGSGGDRIEASETASEGRGVKVLYFDKRQSHGWLERVFEMVSGGHEDIREAFISREAVQLCEDLVVVLYDPLRHRKGMENLGHGSYALYRFK